MHITCVGKKRSAATSKVWSVNFMCNQSVSFMCINVRYKPGGHMCDYLWGYELSDNVWMVCYYYYYVRMSLTVLAYQTCMRHAIFTIVWGWAGRIWHVYYVCDILWGNEPGSNVWVVCHYYYVRMSWAILAYQMCVRHAIIYFCERMSRAVLACLRVWNVCEKWSSQII